MVKKLVILDPQSIQIVSELARKIKSPKAKNGDFSKALRKIIHEYNDR